MDLASEWSGAVSFVIYITNMMSFKLRFFPSAPDSQRFDKGNTQKCNSFKPEKSVF